MFRHINSELRTLRILNFLGRAHVLIFSLLLVYTLIGSVLPQAFVYACGLNIFAGLLIIVVARVGTGTLLKALRDDSIVPSIDYLEALLKAIGFLITRQEAANRLFQLIPAVPREDLVHVKRRLWGGLYKHVLQRNLDHADLIAYLAINTCDKRAIHYIRQILSSDIVPSETRCLLQEALDHLMTDGFQ